MSVKDDVLEDCVNYVSQYIYNDTEIQLKDNVKLIPLNFGKLCKGMVCNNVIYTNTPNRYKFYYMYIIPNKSLSSMVSSDSWVTVTSLANDENIYMDLYTKEHKVIPKHLSYIKRTPEDELVIAIERSALDKLIDGNNNTFDIYLTGSIDPDAPDPRTVISISPGDITGYSKVSSILNSTITKEKSLLFIDGYCYPNTHLSLANSSTDYIEVSTDKSLVHQEIYDLSDRNTYMSLTEGYYKDIILLDKDITDGKIFTYDTITVIVRDKITKKGLILPFIDDNSISQLTTGGFGITSLLIDDKITVLEGTDFEIVIMFFDYKSGKSISRSSSHLDVLYMNDDTTISKAIRGDGSIGVDPWKAPRLESSLHLKYMMYPYTPSGNVDNDIAEFVNTLGFDKFASVCCKSLGDVNFDESGNRYISKPSWYAEKEVIPILYTSSGNKIPFSSYSYYDEDDKVRINIDSSLFTNTDVISYRLITKKDPRYWYCDTTEEKVYLIEALTEFSVYREVNVSTNNLGLSSNKGYTKIHYSEAFAIVTEGSTSRLAFLPELDDKYLIVETGCSVQFQFSVDIDDTDFVLTPRVQDLNTGSYFPLFVNSFEVYLNGKRLTDGVEYKVVEVTKGTVTKGLRICLQSVSYLSSTSANNIEVIKTNEVYINNSTGYLTDNYLPFKSGFSYSENITEFTVSGSKVKNAKLNNRLSSTEYISNTNRNGSLVTVQTSIDKSFYDMFNSYETATTKDNKLQVDMFREDRYINTQTEVTLVSTPTKIFSIYLHEIINRILSRDIVLTSLDNDDLLLMELSPYDWIKEYDVLFDDNHIDYRFVDVYPHVIRDLQSDDIELILVINRLVKLILAEDTETDYRTVRPYL